MVWINIGNNQAVRLNLVELNTHTLQLNHPLPTTSRKLGLFDEKLDISRDLRLVYV